MVEVENPLVNTGDIETWVQSLGQKDRLGEGMEIHSNPTVREAWWAAVYRVTWTQTELRGLSVHHGNKYGGSFAVYVYVLSSFSRVQLCVTLWAVARQAPLSMGFFQQEYWNGLPCPPPGDLPDPGIKPASPASPTLLVEFFITDPLWRFLKNLKVELPCDPAIPLLGRYLEKTLNSKWYLCPNVHGSTIYNSQDMEAT